MIDRRFGGEENYFIRSLIHSVACRQRTVKCKIAVYFANGALRVIGPIALRSHWGRHGRWELHG